MKRERVEEKKNKKKKKEKKSKNLLSVLGISNGDELDDDMGGLFDKSKAEPIIVEEEEEEEDEIEKVVESKVETNETLEYKPLSAKEEAERNERSIFVGGVPVTTKIEKLSKHFSKYGKVESCRLRSITFSKMTNNRMKKVGYIKKNFHEKRDTCNAYVVFEHKDSVSAALAENGKDDFASGYFLRVDFAAEPTIKHKKSIFVGNLPFDVTENDVRKVFAEVGPVEYVRVVRDKTTGLGRGYAYVCFERKVFAQEAAELSNVKVRERIVRIERCKKPETMNAVKEKKKEQGKRRSRSSSYQGPKRGKPKQKTKN